MNWEFSEEFIQLKLLTYQQLQRKWFPSNGCMVTFFTVDIFTCYNKKTTCEVNKATFHLVVWVSGTCCYWLTATLKWNKAISSSHLHQWFSCYDKSKHLLWTTGDSSHRLAGSLAKGGQRVWSCHRMFCFF